MFWVADYPTWMHLGGHLLVWWKVSILCGVWFGLISFFFQVISPRRATRRKDPNFYKLTYLTHQVTHTHTHTIFYQAAYSFFVLRLHLSHCVCCRGRAPHPCHTIFIVFLILPLPTSTVHWHKGWTLPLRWDKGHKFTHTHTHTHTQSDIHET